MTQKGYDYHELKDADLKAIRSEFEDSEIKQAAARILQHYGAIEDMNLFALNLVWGQLVKNRKVPLAA